MDSEVEESSSCVSSPRSSSGGSTGPARIKCLCSYGGRILPRPQDAQLRYIGGETRILVLERGEALASVMAKLEKLCSSPSQGLLLKYQLRSEELDALVSVVSDEDLEHMLDECAKLAPERLRTFVFFRQESPRTKPSAAAMVKRQLSARLEGSARPCLDAPKLQASPVENQRVATCCGFPRQRYYHQQQQQYLFGACSNCRAAVVQGYDAAGLLEARYRLMERQQRCSRQVVVPRNPGFEYVVPAVRHF